MYIYVHKVHELVSTSIIHYIQVQVVLESNHTRKWQVLLLGWLANSCVLAFYNPGLKCLRRRLGLLSQLLPLADALISLQLSSPESSLRKTSKPYSRKNLLAAYQKSLDNSMRQRQHLLLQLSLTW